MRGKQMRMRQHREWALFNHAPLLQFLSIISLTGSMSSWSRSTSATVCISSVRG